HHDAEPIVVVDPASILASEQNPFTFQVEYAAGAVNSRLRASEPEGIILQESQPCADLLCVLFRFRVEPFRVHNTSVRQRHHHQPFFDAETGTTVNSEAGREPAIRQPLDLPLDDFDLVDLVV